MTSMEREGKRQEWLCVKGTQGCLARVCPLSVECPSRVDVTDVRAGWAR